MIKYDTRIEIWSSKDLKKRVAAKAKKLKIKQSDLGRQALEAFLKKN